MDTLDVPMSVNRLVQVYICYNQRVQKRTVERNVDCGQGQQSYLSSASCPEMTVVADAVFNKKRSGF